VARGERLEAVHELAAATAVGVLADAGGDEDPVLVERLADAVYGEFADAGEIGVAAREQVRARLAEDELHALGDQEGGCERESQAHPARIKLPELPTPDERLWGAAASCWAGDEEQADDEDDGGGCDEAAEDEEPCWDALVVLERV
jgi:hypothetical protein